MNPSDASEILPNLEKGAEVLFVRLRSLGDVVLSTPALAALHAFRPDLRLVVAVEPSFAPILEGHPAVSEIFAFRRFLPAAFALARRRFPLALNQHGGPTSALLIAATLAPHRVAWQRSQFPFLANVRVPGPQAFFGPRRVHTAEHRLTQLWWIGLPRGPIPPARIYPQPDALAAVETILSRAGVAPGRPYAVLQPGAAFSTRRWPVANFPPLIEWLASDRNLAPVILLGPGERALRAEAASAFGGFRPPAVVVEGLDLRQMIALISRARLFVGHDTGPTHVAAATGRPVVEIFGSSLPDYWRPWATASRVVANDFPCRPCRGDRCYAFDHPRCIQSVTLDQVRGACRDLLEETESTHL